MALRCMKDCWILSEKGYFKYNSEITDQDGGIIRPADIPGITSPPLMDDEIDWDEGEFDDEGNMVVIQGTHPHSGRVVTRQRQVRKHGRRIDRLKELGLFVEIGGERDDDQKVTTAEDRILADLEKRSGFADEEIVKLYREAGIRSTRNKLDLLEKLMKS